MAAEKVWVEAEQTSSGAILTLRDVRKRRRLQNKHGRHNVDLATKDLKKLGFPDSLKDDLKRGRPVQFRMNESAYEALVEGTGLSGLDALAESYDEEAYTHYVIVNNKGGWRGWLIESGWEYKEDAKDQQQEVEGSKVFTRRTLVRENLDPAAGANWIGGS